MRAGSAQVDHTETPVHLLPAFRDTRRLGVSVSPKTDSRRQHPGHLLLLIL